MHNEADNTHQGVILQNQSEAELYKNSLEGESTYINIKNKPVEIFYRKPVLIPSNQSIWRLFWKEREPLLNRMTAYMHLGTSNVIKKYTTKGTPSTTFWKQAFENVHYIQQYFQVPEDETFISHAQLFKDNLSGDCQEITWKAMNMDAWDKPQTLPCLKLSSPIRSPPSPKLRTSAQTPSPQEDRHKIDTSTETTDSVKKVHHYLWNRKGQ